MFALELEAGPFRKLAARRSDVRIAVTGIGTRAAQVATSHLSISPLPALLIMAGYCGALRDGLAVGDVIAPAEVVDLHGHCWKCEGGHGRLLTSSRMIATPLEKRTLSLQYAADAVDMETASVAEVSALRGVPFRAVRAVSDTVETSLAPDLVTLLSGGHISSKKAALALMMKPSLASEFWRLARDTKIAAQRLGIAIVACLNDTNVYR